uniref:Radical SAM superfamily protein n=1 Tax=Candidatus Kentrum sp. SD TaxID=2126332 RepID=A0A450Y5N8_9GAMM|nr:MAG: Radical SAM superfamily protein [Candidatus Kentron sp. SD]VFK40652.1 MAG: Radical SAM superfamily protein [Candidatus Kentron sp. SD]VFK78010.1 MAG: Radical SAM superfamily protein [Candidatus Kentron sp. SD]
MDFSSYGGVTSIITSRGCPFLCTFCSVYAIFGKKHRIRSIDSIIEELRYYLTKGVKIFNIEDDNFTYDMDRVDNITDAICKAELKVELRFPNGITALRMNEDRLKLFSQAGVKQLFFGLESADKVIRKNLKKGFAKYDRILELIRIARSLDIKADMSLVTGFPHQTPIEMAEDLSRLFKDDAIIPPTPYYPIVGTELFHEARKQGILSEDGLEWYEPLNFPIVGKRFNRLDVSSSYLLGMSLSHSGLQKYHHEFLMSQEQLNPQRVLGALRYTGIDFLGRLDSFTASFDLLLFFNVNGYRLSNLIHGNIERFGVIKGQLEMLAAEVLRVTLEIWTHASYQVVPIHAKKAEIISANRFRFRRTDKPLNRVISLFLDKIRE